MLDLRSKSERPEETAAESSAPEVSAPGQEEIIGPLDLRIVSPEPGSEPIQLFFSHGLLREDGTWGYTYTYLPGDLRAILSHQAP